MKLIKTEIHNLTTGQVKLHTIDIHSQSKNVNEPTKEIKKAIAEYYERVPQVPETMGVL